jgi:hypothetical protein
MSHTSSYVKKKDLKIFPYPIPSYDRDPDVFPSPTPWCLFSVSIRYAYSTSIEPIGKASKREDVKTGTRRSGKSRIEREEGDDGRNKYLTQKTAFRKKIIFVTE